MPSGVPKNYEVGRYSEMVMITVAVENKSDKAIKQLKGYVQFRDATGDEVGILPIDVDANIAPGNVLRTDMGHGWRLNQFKHGDVEKVAEREFGSMTASFMPSAIAFEGGGDIAHT